MYQVSMQSCMHVFNSDSITKITKMYVRFKIKKNIEKLF